MSERAENKGGTEVKLEAPDTTRDLSYSPKASKSTRRALKPITNGVLGNYLYLTFLVMFWVATAGIVVYFPEGDLFLTSWERNFDVRGWMAYCQKNYHWPVSATILYVLWLTFGQWAMGKKEVKSSLASRPVLILWNGALGLFSCFGVWRILPWFVNTWSTRGASDGFWFALCHDKSGDWFAGSWPNMHANPHWHDDPVCACWIFLFGMSKIPEMGDTVLQILAKKRPVFLHWYHHITVMWFCWFAWSHLAAVGAFYCLMNFVVHGLMYTWYAFAAAKLKPNWFSKFITLLQITQMVVGSVLAFMTWYFQRNCPGNHQIVIATSLGMYGSYLLLFIHFFYQRYVSVPAQRPKKKTQ